MSGAWLNAAMSQSMPTTSTVASTAMSGPIHRARERFLYMRDFRMGKAFSCHGCDSPDSVNT